MRPTRVRLAAGAVAFGCLLGPAGAALADKPDDEQSPPAPPPEQPEERDEGRDPDRDRGHGGEDGESPPPPEAFVPAPPPDLERPQVRPDPRERRRRERREPRRRHQEPGSPRRAATPAPPRAGASDETEDREREETPAPEPARREEGERREAPDPRCQREVERGEELLTLDDLCAGEDGDVETSEPGRRTASATGTVRGVALLGALALFSAVGLRILARRSRDAR